MHAAGAAQTDLFATINPKAVPLLAAMNGLNDWFGRDTVRIAAGEQGYRSYDTTRERENPSWATNIAGFPSPGEQP